MPRAFTPEETTQIRMRLLEVGRSRVMETGFRKTSVEVLARGAGISKGAFYLFFPSKEALWIELLQAAERETRLRLVALVDDATGPPDEALRQLFGALFETVMVHPMLRALADPEDMAWLQRSLPADVFEEARRDDDKFFASLLRKLKRKGFVRSGVSTTAFTAIPAAALAIVQGRALIGEPGFDAFLHLQIEAWAQALAAPVA